MLQLHWLNNFRLPLHARVIIAINLWKIIKDYVQLHHCLTVNNHDVNMAYNPGCHNNEYRQINEGHPDYDYWPCLADQLIRHQL